MHMYDYETLVYLKKAEVERKANNTLFLHHPGLPLTNNHQREKSNTVQHVIKTITNLF